MQLSQSFCELSHSGLGIRSGKSGLNYTIDIGESPYSQKTEFGSRKKGGKEGRGTRSGAMALSADQADFGSREGELPQIGVYLPVKRPEKQWTPEQLKYIDKYTPRSLEASLRTKTALMNDLQTDLVRVKSELKQLREEQVKAQSPSLESHALVSAQHLKLLEKMSEQTKRLKELTAESKRLNNRVKELERLFLNAKTKLDQSEARAARLSKEITQLRDKQEEQIALTEYYRTTKLKSLHLMGYMTKPPIDKRELNLRFMELDDSQMPVLVEILRQCPFAESLDLEGNLITDTGVKTLCGYLKSFQCRIAYLNLDWNLVNVEGAWALVEAIMGRDYEIENNIAKMSQLEPPQKFSRISISYNRMPSHTALIRKVMEYLKKTQKETIVQLNITKKALTRASAKTVGQAFRAVNQTFAELAEIKSLTGVLDRIKIEQNEMSEGQMENRKVEERASAIRDFHAQLHHLRELEETSEKEALFAAVLRRDERVLRRNDSHRKDAETETADHQ